MDRPIQDTESLSEDPITFDVSDEEWDMYNEPCPECGGTEFYERRREYNIVNCDDDGVANEFITDGTGDTEAVWCRECDTLLYGTEEQ